MLIVVIALICSKVQKEQILTMCYKNEINSMYRLYYYCSSTIPVIALAVMVLFILSNFSVYSRHFFVSDVYATNIKEAEASSTEPTFNDPNLRAELVVQGLSYPTSMAFINNNNKDILVLQKNN
jgi:hypothetical protein